MPDPPTPDPERLFRDQRERLFGLAYRMLGSVAEAEDVVQDVFARLQRGGLEPIDDAPAYLATMTTRAAIDRLRSARVRRERYVGAWLPEPLVAPGPGPADEAETSDTVSMGLLVVLETLAPVERAVFLLREAFEFGYDEIAGIVGRSPENCRQIALRARHHVDARRPRFEPSAATRDALADRFFAACRDGDTEALVALLADDGALVGDGGGNAPAFGRPIEGAEAVARALVALFTAANAMGARLERLTVNGQPGGRYLAPDGGLINVVALDVVDGHVQTVRSVVNPDKLRHLGRTADVRALLAARTRR